MTGVTAARILMIEDSDAIRRPVVTALTARGFAVEAAADGTDLERRLGGFGPDLVILDVMLPGRDGVDLGELPPAGGVGLLGRRLVEEPGGPGHDLHRPPIRRAATPSASSAERVTSTARVSTSSSGRAVRQPSAARVGRSGCRPHRTSRSTSKTRPRAHGGTDLAGRTHHHPQSAGHRRTLSARPPRSPLTRNWHRCPAPAFTPRAGPEREVGHGVGRFARTALGSVLGGSLTPRRKTNG